MIFFTSDHHFSHKNIIRYCNRPFASVEEMNEKMVARWNSVVGVNDTVYYLGDFSLARAPVELYVPLLHGEKYLIMGNHDLCHPLHRKKAERMSLIYTAAGFKTLSLEMTMKISSYNVLLSHMPYQIKDEIEFQSQEDLRRFDIRYKQFQPKDQGNWLLHGHVHEKWKIRNRMINVGVDVWDFSPVPITEIEKILG